MHDKNDKRQETQKHNSKKRKIHTNEYPKKRRKQDENKKTYPDSQSNPNTPPSPNLNAKSTNSSTMSNTNDDTNSLNLVAFLEKSRWGAIYKYINNNKNDKKIECLTHVLQAQGLRKFSDHLSHLLLSYLNNLSFENEQKVKLINLALTYGGSLTNALTRWIFIDDYAQAKQNSDLINASPFSKQFWLDSQIENKIFDYVFVNYNYKKLKLCKDHQTQISGHMKARIKIFENAPDLANRLKQTLYNHNYAKMLIAISQTSLAEEAFLIEFLGKMGVKSLSYFLSNCTQRSRDLIFSTVLSTYKTIAIKLNKQAKDLSPTDDPSCRYPLFIWAMFCNQHSSSDFLWSGLEKFLTNRICTVNKRDEEGIIEGTVLEKGPLLFLDLCAVHGFQIALNSFITYYRTLTEMLAANVSPNFQNDCWINFQSDLEDLTYSLIQSNFISFAANLCELGRNLADNLEAAKETFAIPESLFDYTQEGLSAITSILIYNVEKLTKEELDKICGVFWKIFNFDAFSTFLLDCDRADHVKSVFLSNLTQHTFFCYIIQNPEFKLDEIITLTINKITSLDEAFILKQRKGCPSNEIELNGLRNLFSILLEHITNKNQHPINLNLLVSTIQNSVYFKEKEVKLDDFCMKILTPSLNSINSYFFLPETPGTPITDLDFHVLDYSGGH